MRVLVTGAAGGIGAATAESFLAAGHTVRRHDIRPSDGIHIAGDLSDPRALSCVASFVQQDDIDVVVAAHGLPGPGTLDALEPAFIERVIGVNSVSVLALFDAVESTLRARRGSYIVVSSQAGLRGEGHNTAYAASKFALVGWARAQARRGTGIRFRVLCPGLTETPLLVDALHGMARGEGVSYETHLAQRLRGVPLGRLGRVSEIGRSALWLAELETAACVVAPVTGGTVFN